MLHEHVHAVRLVIFSAKELGTMSKNLLKSDCLNYKVYMEDKLSYPSSSLAFINICVTHGHCVTAFRFL